MKTKCNSKCFQEPPLLNLDDEKLPGLLDTRILEEIKNGSNLDPYTFDEAATSLLDKIDQCVSSSIKLRKIIRNTLEIIVISI
ncbi:hypothetical protein BD770DRAFT_403399 [Pilaira anomala]|nr:hypothetical protein BD770DRAFT_403399 [Pilaira anomala]